jgi:hypothetical protein
MTFTELRIKTNELAKMLNKGREVRLVRKSKIIGRIVPEKEDSYKVIDAEKLEAKIQKLRLPKLTLEEIDRRYRAAMMKKHGQGISRH